MLRFQTLPALDLTADRDRSGGDQKTAGDVTAMRVGRVSKSLRKRSVSRKSLPNELLSVFKCQNKGFLEQIVTSMLGAAYSTFRKYVKKVIES